MAREFRGAVARRSAALYAANLVTLSLPLASVPYLARVLGPVAWGELAIGQAIATVLAVLIDYGHGQSGTRDLVRACASGDGRRFAATVLASKLVLAIAAATLVVTVAGFGLLPVRPDLVPAAIAAGVAIGSSPLWLVQAGDRIGRYLALDVTVKVAAVAALFVLVDEPSDAPRVLWLQAGAGTVSLAGGLFLSQIRPAFWLPTPAAIARLLHEQRYGFLFRTTILTYTTANVLVLGFLARPQDVGLFAAAERAVRVVANFAGPLGQALFPILARSWREDPVAAARLARRATVVVAGIGALFGLCFLVGAEQIALFLLGSQFAGAAPLLAILAPLPLLIGVSNILGVQWMFSIRAEDALVRILVVAGAACLPTGALLATIYGAPGMAVAATVAETLVTAGILAHLARSKSLPTAFALRRPGHAH
ncbi:MAG: oligosaccharide flippase family protein [Geminicoccaceae bacterium]|nr:oligosaccharide flippase family protein [Geminicoccaceae bacterium]